ncbi:MAG: tetratricopeptide repeat protein [Candidatus Binataceae bacterium]
MKFCPECGAATQPGAKFCVSCGQPLSPDAVRPRAPIRIPAGFAAVFLGVLLVGLAVGGILVRQQRKVRAKAESVGASSNLPPGHPQVELPAKAIEFIKNLESQAKNQPKDIVIWNRLGTVALRASLFDQSYFRLASEAYGHVLELDPDNLEALRGIGNLNYDRQKYDQAIAAYEHYLKHKPDDPDVQTDLGTMYLYTGNADQAIKRYQKALSIKPNAFEPYYNLGVAYAALNNNAQARASLQQALKYATDQDSKSRVNDLLAKMAGGAGTQVASSGGSAGGGIAAPAAPANSFEGQIEAMVRGLPFAGPKVASVKWTSKNKATVLMNNFPMEAMPPFARQKFLGDLADGIQEAKKTYHVDGPFELQIADAASGQVMETVSK